MGELGVHPDCPTDGLDLPSWCSQKWCFVDPCRCRTSSPPLVTMNANRHLRFQGKSAHWSSETCGSIDTWTPLHPQDYCVNLQSEEECAKQRRCSWNSSTCLAMSFAELCPTQEETGLLALEPVIQDSVLRRFCDG